MADKGRTPAEDAGAATDGISVETTELGKGKVLLRAWKSIKLSGPPSTYTSVEYGHSLTAVVEDDEMTVASRAEDMRLLIKVLNDDAREAAYGELLDHINATNARKFSEER